MWLNYNLRKGLSGSVYFFDKMKFRKNPWDLPCSPCSLQGAGKVELGEEKKESHGSEVTEEILKLIGHQVVSPCCCCFYFFPLSENGARVVEAEELRVPLM